MLFGVLSGVPDVITHTKFCVNRLRGFSVAAPRKVPFPILFRTTLTRVLHYRADCDYDHYDYYHDENVNRFDDKNVVCHPVWWWGASAIHLPVLSPVMPDVFDRSRTFRPIRQGRWDMPCESPRSLEPRPKSRGWSRTASRVSGGSLDWLGDFMKKFADDASSRKNGW